MLSISGVITSIAEGGRENPKYASYTEWPPDYILYRNIQGGRHFTFTINPSIAGDHLADRGNNCV